MAGAALTVDLNARIANFEKGMTQANRALDKLETNSKQTNAALAGLGATATKMAKRLAALFAVERFATMASDSLQWADALDNAASRLGVTNRLLQALRARAEDFGSSIEATDTALQRFGRRLGEVRAGGAKNLAKILTENNVALRDAEGNYRSVTAVLGDYSKILAGASDEARRNALAMAAFDSEGVRFGQTLAGINGDLVSFTDKMDELGYVVSDRAVKALDDAEQNMAEFGKTLKFVARNTLGTVLDTFTRLWSKVQFGIDPLEDMNAHVKAFELNLNQVSAAAKTVPDFTTIFASKGVETLLTEDQLKTAFARIDTLYDGALSRADEFRQRVLAIGEPQGLQTIGELDILDVYRGFSALQSLLASGDTAKAQTQVENLALAMAQLSESADAGTKLAIGDIKRALADISDKVFTPKVDRNEIKDALISQVVAAQAYATGNPLKWKVELDVAGYIDDQATAFGLKP